MRPGVFVLAVAAGLAAAAPLDADEWTQIDVVAKLADDGRVTVVETHHVVLESSDKKVFRDFGLGADQAIRLTAVTRIGPDGEEHPLGAVDEVTAPDQFRYYDQGHVYYWIPPLPEKAAVVWRFEYELIGAVAPAWAIAAGPATRASGELEFQWPWYRAAEIAADWREAWPALATRYRFDHDVLLPDRDGLGHVFRRIDYDLEYGSAWREVFPDKSVGDAVPGGAYRAHVLFDYAGEAPPPAASSAAAGARLFALASPPVVGLLAWLVYLAAARSRRGPPIDRRWVEQRFLSRSPEEIAYWLDDRRPTFEGVLSRLATEGAIAIRVDRASGHVFDADGDDGLLMRMHVRRVAADGTLTAFEDAILDDLFGEGRRELTTESHLQRHAGRDYDPADALERRLLEADRVKRGMAPGAGPLGRAAGQFSLPRLGLLALLALGIAGVFRDLGPLFDIAPIAAIWAFFTVALVNAWPKAWWYRGRPTRGLLLPLVLLVAMQASWLLMPNRPLPAGAWVASAISVLAAYFLTLVRAGIPAGQGGAIGDLARMRDRARDELDRSRPHLDDRWIPRLRALGLGPEIARWRTRHGGAFSAPPEGGGEGPRLTDARFTGMEPAPWRGPDGWATGLEVYADADEDDGADDEDPHDDEAAPTAPRREREPAGGDA